MGRREPKSAPSQSRRTKQGKEEGSHPHQVSPEGPTEQRRAGEGEGERVISSCSPVSQGLEGPLKTRKHGHHARRCATSRRTKHRGHRDDGCHSDPEVACCLVTVVQTLASLLAPSIRHLQPSCTGRHHLQNCGAGSAGIVSITSHGYHPEPCALQADISKATDQEASKCQLNPHENIGRQT